MSKKVFAICIGVLAVFCASSLFANTTTANWGAQITNGVGLANGTPLPNGSNDLILLGSFNITNAQITANGSNEAFLMSHFTTFGSAVIGQGNPNGLGSPSDGYWTGVSSNSASALSLQNKEIFYWVFNSPIATTATQYGIFTAPSNSNWVFPNDTNTAQSNTTDLNQVAHDMSAILFGSYGTGLSRDGVSPLYNLGVVAVPEPSTWAGCILAAGTIASGVVRRRVRR